MQQQKRPLWALVARGSLSSLTHSHLENQPLTTAGIQGWQRVQIYHIHDSPLETKLKVHAYSPEVYSQVGNVQTQNISQLDTQE